MISLVLMIAAIVCLFLAAFNVPVGRPSLGWFGMGLWALSTVVGPLG
jgi:hypothetical protein